MSNGGNKNTESKTGIIIGLGIALAVGAAVLCIALVSVLGKNSIKKEDTTFYNTTRGSIESVSETVGGLSDLQGATVGGADVNIDAGGNTQTYSETAGNTYAPQTNNAQTTENDAVQKYEQLSKNGDNVLSDHYNNEFIKLVSSKYDVDADLLVAIYSVPDTGNNFVLQFDGTKDSSGNIVKSPDTLKKVYQIDKDKNIKIATGTQSGNVGVSYAEGLFCFNMVKKLVMTQYPDYFTGLDS